jgi:hypothetical protein
MKAFKHNRFRSRSKERNFIFLGAVCNCVFGDVARFVYSRTFPSLTTPQTGRLNKSPHTVHAIANRHEIGKVKVQLSRPIEGEIKT